MNIKLFILFPVVIFQDLIGNDFPLSFNGVCLVHQFSSLSLVERWTITEVPIYQNKFFD